MTVKHETKPNFDQHEVMVELKSADDFAGENDTFMF